MAVVPPPPYRAPFLDPRTGEVSRPWTQWLQAVLARLGGVGDVTPLGTLEDWSRLTPAGELGALLMALDQGQLAPPVLAGPETLGDLAPRTEAVAPDFTLGDFT